MKSDKMGSVMMSSVKYIGMYQFDPIKGMPAGHMKNEQFFVISLPPRFLSESTSKTNPLTARGIVRISLVSRVFHWRSF